jgi:hypothetical protein
MYLLDQPSIGDACRLWAYPLCGRKSQLRILVRLPEDRVRDRLESSLATDESERSASSGPLESASLFAVQARGAYEVGLVFDSETGLDSLATVRVDPKEHDTSLAVSFRRGGLYPAWLCFFLALINMFYGTQLTADVWEAIEILSTFMGMAGLVMLYLGLRDRRTVKLGIRRLFPEALPAA